MIDLALTWHNFSTLPEQMDTIRPWWAVIPYVPQGPTCKNNYSAF